jgi:hypothetical protein
MFQFRFVILTLLIPLAGLSALLVGTSTVYGIVMPPFDAAAATATGAVNGAIKSFASLGVDAAATAAADPDVQAALTRGELTPKAESSLLMRAGTFGPPSFGLLVGVDGAVKAVGGADPKLEPNVAGLPIVAEALTGVARDAVLLRDDAPIQLAASPSYAPDGKVAGVVVLGWTWNNELAQVAARVAGVPNLFLSTPKKIYGALPEGVSAAEIKARAPFGAPTHPIGPLPMLLPDRARFLVPSTLLPGTDLSVIVMTLIDRDGAFEGIASMQAGILVVTLALMLLVLGIVVSAVRGVNRPIELITEHLSRFQKQGPSVGIIPEAGLGPLLRLGKQINTLLQALPSARPGATAPLFSAPPSTASEAPMFASPPLTGATPAPSLLPSSFHAPVSSPGAAGLPPVQTPVPSMPSTSTLPSALAPSPLPSPPPAPASGALASLFDDGPDPLAAFRVPAKPTGPAAPPQPSPPPPPAPVSEPPEHAMNPEATVMFQVPEALLAASSAAPPKPVAAPVASPARVDDNRTVVAQVPAELLAQVAPKGDPAAADDEAHYKEVYEKFLQTRIDCGEDTSDLSYDRFVAKLLKNRQQILEKHKAKTVRFQVYAKDGKAALRALPVRD